MAYCVLSDLEAAKLPAVLIELAGEQMTVGPPSVGSGHPTTVVVDWAIAKADSIIDCKLGRWYTVPFTTVPAIIKNISIDLSIAFLYQHNQITLPKEIKEQYDLDIGLLDDIASGVAGLGLIAVFPTLGPTIEYSVPYEHNKFDMNCLEADGDPDFMTDTE